MIVRSSQQSHSLLQDVTELDKECQSCWAEAWDLESQNLRAELQISLIASGGPRQDFKPITYTPTPGSTHYPSLRYSIHLRSDISVRYTNQYDV